MEVTQTISENRAAAEIGGQNRVSIARSTRIDRISLRRARLCSNWRESRQSCGSACGPVIVPVFKTGGRRVTPSPVGSTPTRFRHFSMHYESAPLSKGRGRVWRCLRSAALVAAERFEHIQIHRPFIGEINARDEAQVITAETVEHVHLHIKSQSSITPNSPFATVPPLPPNFIDRPEVSEPLRERLLSNARPVALTAIEGMGGVGKTVVALGLCHDSNVRAAFPDGIAHRGLHGQ